MTTAITGLLSFACYIAALWLRWRTEEAAKLRWALWGAGCLWLAVHILSAFALHHGWSHPEAYEHIANRTEAGVGIRWGGGVYFNYITLLLWSADCLFHWTAPRSAHPQLGRIVDGWLCFMWISATLLFGTWLGRTCGLIGFAFLTSALWLPRRR